MLAIPFGHSPTLAIRYIWTILGETITFVHSNLIYYKHLDTLMLAIRYNWTLSGELLHLDTLRLAITFGHLS